MFNIPIEMSTAIPFFCPKGYFTSALEELHCLFLKGKTDVLDRCESSFYALPYTFHEMKGLSLEWTL